MSISTDVSAAGNIAWRDFITEGVASSGENKAQKAEIRAFVAAVSAAIATLDASIVDVAASALASGVTYWRSTSDLLPAGTTNALGFVRLGTDAGLWVRDTSGAWSNTNLVFPSLIAADIAGNTSAIAAEVAARTVAVAETNGRVDLLDTGLTAATSAIGGLTTGLGETNGRVDVLDTGLTAATSAIGSLTTGLGETNGRVDVLDTGLTAATSAIGGLTTGLGETNGRVDILDTGLTAATSAIGSLTTGLGETNGRVDVLDTGLTAATSAIGSLTTGLGETNGRVDMLDAAVAAETARATAAEAVISARVHLGDAPGAFGSALTGAITASPAYTAASVAVDSALGASILLTGDAYVAPRAPIPIEPGRVYLVRWAARRKTAPADPLSDAVVYGVQWLTGALADAGSTIRETLPLPVSDGALRRTMTASLDVAGVDIVIPSGARQCRPWIRTYGVTHQTYVGIVDLVDITEAWAAQQTASAAATPAAVTAAVAAEATRAQAAETSLAGASAALAREARGGRDIAWPGMLYGAVDGAGVQAGLDWAGWHVGYGSRTIVPDRSGAGPALWGVLDEDGRSPLYLDHAYRLNVASVAFKAGGSDRSTAGPYAWAIADEDDVLAIGVGHDGKVTIPSLGAGGASAGYVPPAALGVAGAYNVRTASDGSGRIYGTVHLHGGRSMDVMRDPAAPYPTTAVAITDDPIACIIYYGQSMAGGGSGSEANPIVDGPYPNNIFFPQGYSAYGTSDQTAAINAYTQMRPYIAEQFTPISALGTAIIAQDIIAGRVPSVLNICHEWEGGQEIDKFFPGVAGKYNYENFIAQCAALTRTAGHYRTAKLKAIYFAQGETVTVAGYGASLTALVDLLVPAAAAAAGQSELPEFFIRQSNSKDDADPQLFDSVLATLAVARDRFGAGFTLTGPMYMCPMHDGLHYNSVGRAIFGDVEADAYHEVVTKGGVWHPLWPAAGGITRSGAVITIPMELPPGATGLALDDDWVPACAHRGFAYADDSSGATIASVAISGSAIVITLSADPGSATGKMISYGMWESAIVTNWARGRGQVYAQTNRKCGWRHLGYDVAPFDTIRHYCVKFEEYIS